MLFKAIYYGKEHRKAYHIPAKWNGDFCLSDYSHNPKTQSDWAARNHCMVTPQNRGGKARNV